MRVEGWMRVQEYWVCRGAGVLGVCRKGVCVRFVLGCLCGRWGASLGIGGAVCATVLFMIVLCVIVLCVGNVCD